MLPGLHIVASFRLDPIFLYFCLGGEGRGSGDPNFFVNISSSWVKISLHTEFQLRRLPGSRNASLRLNPICCC